VIEREVTVTAEAVELGGAIALPDDARGLVIFAHGSGSGRSSPRNRLVAAALQRAGLATLLFDLLTADEDEIDRRTRALRFDIPLLAERLAGATAWAGHQREAGSLRVGYFGASTGAAAALVAAADRPEVGAVVSRGGRPDLAGEALRRVRAPTLLLVGGEDRVVLGLNRQALAAMEESLVELEVLPGASHLFEEPGALEEVATMAAGWFTRHLA
jgi:dienelactone hydrolase